MDSLEKSSLIFFSKDKSKKLKCHLLQFLFGALRVKKISMSPATERTNHSTKKSNYTAFSLRNVYVLIIILS